ncbi:MAG: hypothetical protein AAGM16_03245 [Pseudomonadota bacterium]
MEVPDWNELVIVSGPFWLRGFRDHGPSGYQNRAVWQVAAALASYFNQEKRRVWASQTTLEAAARTTGKTLRAALRTLEDARWVVTLEKRERRGKSWRHFEYVLVMPFDTADTIGARIQTFLIDEIDLERDRHHRGASPVAEHNDNESELNAGGETFHGAAGVAEGSCGSGA